MRIAIDRLQSARGELLQVQLGWLPTLKIYGGYSKNPALGAPGLFYGLWPYYLINIAHHFNLQKQAEWNVGYHRAAIDGVKVTLIGQIAITYFTLLAQKEQLQILRQLKKETQELIKISQKTLDIGLDTEIDISDLLVDYELLKAQLRPVENNIVISQNALRFLINENPGPIKTAKVFSSIPLETMHPGAYPASVLNYRPDIRMAKFAIKRAFQRIPLAYSDFFPSLNLDDFIGEAHLPQSTFEQAADAYLSVDLSLATLGKIMAEKGAYKAEIDEYIKTIHLALKEVDNDFSSVKRFRQHYQENKGAEKKYQDTFGLQKGLLKTGLISYTELLRSQINLTRMALATTQAKLEWAIAVTKLYQDLGGGYKCL